MRNGGNGGNGGNGRMAERQKEWKNGRKNVRKNVRKNGRKNGAEMATYVLFMVHADTMYILIFYSGLHPKKGYRMILVPT